jgi:hypothetical protein
MSDDLSDYEAEVADVVDPSPFVQTDIAQYGIEVLNIIGDAVEYISKDIAALLNNGDNPIVQYTVERNGYAVTARLISRTQLGILVDYEGGFVVNDE